VTVAITSPRDRALVSFLGSDRPLRASDIPDAALAEADTHVRLLSPGATAADLQGCSLRARRLGLTTSSTGFDPTET